MSFSAAPGLKIETTKGGLILVVPGHPPKRIRLVVDGAELPPDLRTVDALARDCLAARRDGCELRLSDASTELRELLDLCGLAQALPCVEGSGLEGEGQSEGREEPRGVEEERDPSDSVP